MKKLNTIQLENLNGGSTESAIIAGISCGLTALTWATVIGPLIFGPTCVGTVIGTVVD